jgi:hypothetical protein
MERIELQWHGREDDHLGGRKELQIFINGQSLIEREQVSGKKLQADYLARQKNDA